LSVGNPCISQVSVFANPLSHFNDYISLIYSRPLIVSNIPAKIGGEAITKEFILAPYGLLNPRGELWVVVVSALNRLIPKLGGVNKMKVKAIRKRRGHTVYQISKPQ